MTIEDVDLLIVGGGKAGKTLAMERARAGQSVAMVERGMIGGTCINVACIPTKTVINSGRILQDVRRAGEFGIAGVGEPRIDIELLLRRKESVVDAMVQGQFAAFTESGMDLILGEAKFVAPRTVQVALNDGGVRTLRGADVVLNLGMSPYLPDIEGLGSAGAHTSETLLRLDSLPESIIVLGGGYIGCEFADVLNTLGVEVTVVQRGPLLLAREDNETSEGIAQAFLAAGITLRLGETARRVSRADDGTVSLALDSGAILTASELLVAVGRTPETSEIGLEQAGVRLTDRGFIAVDEYLRTSAERVWAAGDAAGTPQFTHASYDDYRVLATNLAAQAGQGELRSTQGRLIPYCVFTTPELARVGLTEAEARAAGYDVRIARMPVAAIPRARTIGHLEGTWTAVIDRDSRQILGAALRGPEASEAIAVVQMAMLAGLEYTRVRDAIIAHPTIAEGLNLLFTPAFLEAEVTK